MKQKREVNVELVTKAKGKVDYPSMLIRKVTVPMSVWLAKYTTINPTHITYFSVLVMIASLFLMAYSGFTEHAFTLRLIGACLVFFAYILDHLDGKMARMLNTTSLKGKWIDEISGFLYLTLIFVAMFVGLRTNDYTTAIIAMTAAIAAPLHYLIIYSYKYGIEPKITEQKIKTIKKESWLKYIYGPIYMYILIIVFCAIDKPTYIFWFWLIVENLFWIGIAILQCKAVIKYDRQSKQDKKQNKK